MLPELEEKGAEVEGLHGYSPQTSELSGGKIVVELDGREMAREGRSTHV